MILATATQTGLTLADYAVISSIIGVVERLAGVEILTAEQYQAAMPGGEETEGA
jgi:hypothetical protein